MKGAWLEFGHFSDDVLSARCLPSQGLQERSNDYHNTSYISCIPGTFPYVLKLQHNRAGALFELQQPRSGAAVRRTTTPRSPGESETPNFPDAFSVGRQSQLLPPLQKAAWGSSRQPRPESQGPGPWPHPPRLAFGKVAGGGAGGADCALTSLPLGGMRAIPRKLKGLAL